MVSLGRNKSIAVGKLPVGKTLRRINFFYSPPNEYVFAKLYYTGNMSFGKVMRSFAKRAGYSLSEYGLSKNGEKVSYNFTDERSIFQFLNMRYVRPHKRKHGGVAAAAWQRPSSMTSKTISKEKMRSKKAGSSGISHLQLKYDHCYESDDSDFQTIAPVKKKISKRRKASLLDDHGESKETNNNTAPAFRNSELVLKKLVPVVKKDRTATFLRKLRNMV